MNTTNGSKLLAVDDTQQPHVYKDISTADPQLPTTLEEVFADSDGWQRLQDATDEATPLEVVDPSALLAPIAAPGKILCIGLNYADHAAETGAKVGDEPVVFNKLPTTLRGPLDEVHLPAVSSQVDYEAELVVVIGKPAKNVAQQDAFNYVAGYMCGNDVSSRDWQKGKPGGQWLLGKSFDSFAPTGPFFVSRDEIADPHDLEISLTLNGEIMQQSNTSQLIFRIDVLISYLSQVCTLLPGDLLFTGTPGGVGIGRNPPRFLQSGDEMTVQVTGLGQLQNRCVEAN